MPLDLYSCAKTTKPVVCSEISIFNGFGHHLLLQINSGSLFAKYYTISVKPKAPNPKGKYNPPINPLARRFFRATAIQPQLIHKSSPMKQRRLHRLGK